MVNKLLEPRNDDIFEFEKLTNMYHLYINTKLYIKLTKNIEKNKSQSSFLLYDGFRRKVIWTDDGWAEFKIKIKIDGKNYIKDIIVNSLKFYENDCEDDEEDILYAIKLNNIKK